MARFTKIAKVVPDKPKFRKTGTVTQRAAPTAAEIENMVQKRVAEEMEKQERVSAWKQKAAQFREEAKQPYKKLAEETGAGKAFLIGAGKGLTDVGRGVGRLFGADYSKAIEEEKAGYQALQEARPISTTLGEITGETAPFVPVTFGLGGLAATGRLGTHATRIAATRGGQVGLAGLMGMAETGTAAAGRGEGIGDIAKEAGIGGTAAAVGETVLPPVARTAARLAKRTLGPTKAGQAARKLYEKATVKIKGKMPEGALVTETGAPKPEVDKALEEYGLSTKQATDEELAMVGEELSKMPEYSDPKEAARSVFLEKYGLTGDAAPTKAQIKRTADAFQDQQEAMKRSTMVRGRVENQNALIKNRFEDVGKMTGGRLDTSGSPVFDAVLNKATDLDNRIGLMYDIAAKKSGGKKTVEPKQLLRILRKMTAEGDTELDGGLINSIKKVLKTRKVMAETDKGIKTGRKMNVKESENLVQIINRRYKKSDKNQNRIGRQLKNAIDDDVTKSGGSDLFRAAREEKAKFHRDLKRTQESKFSGRDKSLHRDILESKILPDDLYTKGILSSGYWPSEVNDLKNYLTKTGSTPQKLAGKRAWNDLRAEAIEHLKDTSFGGPIDQLENRTITRNRFEKAIRKIGPGKRQVLFTPEENRFLDQTMDVLKLMEPISGTQQGKGPSAQAVEAAMKKWEKVRAIGEASPILKPLADLELRKAKKALVGKPTVKIPSRVSATAGPTAAAAADRLEDENE